MLYIATQRTSWLLIGFLLFVGGAFAASRLFAHVSDRFTIWLHPFAGNNPYATPASSWSRACTGWPSAGSSAPGWATASRT